MGEKLIKPGSRHFKINNAWLAKYTADTTKYVDIYEIHFDPTTSQYLEDLVAMGVITKSDYPQIQQRAGFWVNGVRIGTGGVVRRVMEEEHPNYADTNTYGGGIIHEERWLRVYASQTTARDIEWVGIGEKSSAGRGE